MECKESCWYVYLRSWKKTEASLFFLVRGAIKEEGQEFELTCCQNGKPIFTFGTLDQGMQPLRPVKSLTQKVVQSFSQQFQDVYQRLRAVCPEI